MKPKTFRGKITLQISEAEKYMFEQKLTEAFELIDKIGKSLAQLSKVGTGFHDDFVAGAMERIEQLKRRLVKEMARKL